MESGTRVRIVNHHIKEFNGLVGIVLGVVPNTYYGYRVSIERQFSVCGPMVRRGPELEVTCDICKTIHPVLKKDKDELFTHQFFVAEGVGLGQFTIELNIFNLEKLPPSDKRFNDVQTTNRSISQ